MSTQQSVERDERTVAVENTGYRWAYIFLAFALFIDVVYRGMLRHEAAWDLMVLVIVSSAVCTVYQARQKILGKTWVKEAVLVTCLGAIIGFIVLVVALAIKKGI